MSSCGDERRKSRGVGESRISPKEALKLWWGELKLTRITDTTHSHDAMATPVTHGDASHAPVEVSFPLPKAPRTNIHLQLRDNGPNITLFLTTSTPESASAVPLGSLVYAMPNV
jgi:hypothetical protein